MAIPRYQDVTNSASDGTIHSLFSPDTIILPPIRSGDVLALPHTSPAYENAHAGNVGTTLGDELFLFTGNVAQPIAVNPASPRLPSAALAGLSPYISWFGSYTQGPSEFRTDLPGEPPKVFDLRTGKLVDIRIGDPRKPESQIACVVGGHWVAWVANEGTPSRESLYLADLSTGRARRLLDGKAPTGELAISDDWLLWADGSGSLSGFHLPDMSRVEVHGVLRSGEQDDGLEISGNLAVLTVFAPGGNPLYVSPNFSPAPKYTAIRVVRLK